MEKLAEVVEYLASCCDGARKQDGAGFNKPDSYFGKSLACLPPDLWGYDEQIRAYEMIRKYEKQYAHICKFSELVKPEYQIEEETRRREAKEIHFKTLSDQRQREYNIKKFGVEEWRYVRVEKDEFIFSFSYNAELVAEMGKLKDICHPRFNWTNKEWHIVARPEYIADIVGFADNNGFQFKEGVQTKLDELAELLEVRASNVEESKKGSSEFRVEGLSGELRPFQRAGVEYAVKNKRVIIADEMGLGKTIQALGTIQALNAYPALIVCPASLKLNWRNEVKKWLPEKKIVICNGVTAGGDEDIIIINYDILKKHQYLKERKIQSIILDESHYCKNFKTIRTKLIKELSADIDIRILLTGTPVLNRPSELISQLEILGRLGELGGWFNFAKRYCGAYRTRFGWDLSGATHLEELNQKMRGLCFVRRKKADVLKELPAKQRSIVSIDIDNRKEYQKAENDLINYLRGQAVEKADFLESIQGLTAEEKKQAKRERADEAGRKAESAEHLVKIETLKQVAVRGKMEAIKTWVEDFLETGEKLVLFGHHKEVVKGIASLFNAPCITGDTPLDKRQDYVEKFQNDPDCKLIVLNIRAGGVGLTLTASSNVAFVELGWNPADHLQAEDRCHRIGQEESVTAYYLIGENTIDQMIYDLIESKRVVVDASTEGEGGNDFKIMNELINKLLNRG